MKNLSLTLISFLLVINLNAQDETNKKPPFFLRPSVETGITFLNNDLLKEAYKTNSIYNIGIGLRFGDANKHNILPYINYSFSSYTYKPSISNTAADTSLQMQEGAIGIQMVIKRFDKGMLRAKAGYITSSIKDEIMDNNGKGNGMQLGLGYEISILKNSRIYIDYSYNFVKFSNAHYRDYDNQKLTIGFIL